MKALWTEPRVTFDGEFWQLDDAAMEPKPFQKPYPPIWFGAASQPALRRAVRHRRRVLRRGLVDHRDVRRAGQGDAEGAGRSGPGRRDFPIAKRVYIAVDDDGARARARINAALERHLRAPGAGIEAAAVAGTPADCVRRAARRSPRGRGADPVHRRCSTRPGRWNGSLRQASSPSWVDRAPGRCRGQELSLRDIAARLVIATGKHGQARSARSKCPRFQRNPDVDRPRRSCVWLRRVRGLGFLGGLRAAGSQRRSWRILSLLTWKTAPIWSRVQPSSLSR